MLRYLAKIVERTNAEQKFPIILLQSKHFKNNGTYNAYSSCGGWIYYFISQRLNEYWLNEGKMEPQCLTLEVI